MAFPLSAASRLGVDGTVLRISKKRLAILSEPFRMRFVLMDEFMSVSIPPEFLNRLSSTRRYVDSLMFLDLDRPPKADRLCDKGRATNFRGRSALRLCIATNRLGLETKRGLRRQWLHCWWRILWHTNLCRYDHAGLHRPNHNPDKERRMDRRTQSQSPTHSVSRFSASDLVR